MALDSPTKLFIAYTNQVFVSKLSNVYSASTQQCTVCAMLRDIFSIFRRKEVKYEELSREALQNLFFVLHASRRNLVDSFYELKNRRLREVYDYFSMMMLSFDKLYQFIRRIAGLPLYVDELAESSCLRDGIDACLSSLPTELAMQGRRVYTLSKNLVSVSSTYPPSAIKNLIMEFRNLVEELAHALSPYLR